MEWKGSGEIGQGCEGKNGEGRESKNGQGHDALLGWDREGVNGMERGGRDLTGIRELRVGGNVQGWKGMDGVERRRVPAKAH